MKTITVTGATGNVGSALIPLLSQAGATVRAITRSPDRLPASESKIVVVEADLADTNAWQDALLNVDALFLLTSGSPTMDALQNKVIEAAQQQKVPLIVKQSAFGAAAEAPVALFRMHHAIEETLKASGIPYCILQPNSFTQNLLAHAQSVKEQGAIYAPRGEGKVSNVDVRDVARVATTVLLADSTAHQGQTYVLTGPAATSMQQDADTIGQVIGKEVNYYPVSYEDGKQAMRGFGMDEWLVDELIAIARLGAEGKAATVTSDVETVTEKPARTVEETIRDLKAVFQE